MRTHVSLQLLVTHTKFNVRLRVNCLNACDRGVITHTQAKLRILLHRHCFNERSTEL